MKMKNQKLARPLAVPFFSLASPKGGEGRGEEAKAFRDQIPSPQPSPRLGGERESDTRYSPQCPTRPRGGWIGRWKLHVKCSMFLSVVLLFLAAFPLRGQTNSEATNAPLTLSPPYGELPPTFFEQHGTILMLAGLGIIASAALGLWLIFHPRPEPIIPPEVQARRALEALRERPEDGAVLSRISQVLRNYFTAAFQLVPGEMTTMEFCAVLAASEKIDAENIRSISNFLHECDKKKFSSSPGVMPLNAVDRALKLIACAETCRLRSAPVPGAATSSGQGATADRLTQSSSDVATSDDGRIP